MRKLSSIFSKIDLSRSMILYFGDTSSISLSASLPLDFEENMPERVSLLSLGCSFVGFAVFYFFICLTGDRLDMPSLFFLSVERGVLAMPSLLLNFTSNPSYLVISWSSFCIQTTESIVFNIKMHRMIYDITLSWRSWSKPALQS